MLKSERRLRMEAEYNCQKMEARVVYLQGILIDILRYDSRVLTHKLCKEALSDIKRN